MLFDFHQPLLNVREGFFAGNVVAEEDTIRASVEDSCNWAERLLTSGIPDLQLDNFVINFHDEATKLHTNRNLMLKFEVVIHHSCQQAWFTDT